jgi:GNAT superfamily N-acetyltransferase
MNAPACKVLDFTDDHADTAVALLSRFFVDEGFAGTPAGIAANVLRMAADPHHWIGLAWADGTAVGIVTVTTMLYIEWGRLGEIGDIFVIESARRKGVAAALMEAAKSKCRGLGCSAVSVVITPQGETRHGLTRFYERFGFVSSGRSIVTHVFDQA